MVASGATSGSSDNDTSESSEDNGSSAPEGSSANQMNQELRKGQAPEGIQRVDKADPNIPGSQDHVHFTGERSTLNRDGTWGHGDTELDLTAKQRKWL
jgi:hypothetical protein